MLIQNLRNLERTGLVERYVYPVVPPKVNYSLTPLGKSLVEPLAVLGEWAYQHISDVNASIELYDSEIQTDNFWQPK